MRDAEKLTSCWEEIQKDLQVGLLCQLLPHGISFSSSLFQLLLSFSLQQPTPFLPSISPFVTSWIDRFHSSLDSLQDLSSFLQGIYLTCPPLVLHPAVPRSLLFHMNFR